MYKKRRKGQKSTDVDLMNVKIYLMEFQNRRKIIKYLKNKNKNLLMRSNRNEI